MKIIKNNSDSRHKKILFLHGTKTGYDSKWMELIVDLLSMKPYEIIRPQFPEIYKTNSENNDQTLSLVDSIATLIDEMNLGEDLIIMGKSLGAKVAVELAKSIPAEKLVLLGYPFTFRSGKIRVERVNNINKLDLPVCIIQGERDKYGSRPIVENIELKDQASIHWIPNVDHNYYLEGETQVTESDMDKLQDYLCSIL